MTAGNSKPLLPPSGVPGRALALFLLLASLQVFAQDKNQAASYELKLRQETDSLFRMARTHLMRDRHDSANQALDRGLMLAEKIHDNEIFVRFYVEKANLFLLRQNYASTYEWLKKASADMDKVTTYRLREKYLLLYGMLFQSLNKTDSAIFYYRSCETLNNREDPYRNWLVYNQMGLLFQQSEIYAEAEKYFLKAYALVKNSGNKADLMILINSLGQLYVRTGEAEKFAHFMSEEQKLLKRDSFDLNKDPIHGMVLVDWSKKALAEKVAFMEHVHRSLMQSGNRVNAALANIYIARFYERDGQPASGVPYLRKNQDIFARDGDLFNLYNNTRIAYRLLKKAGKTEEAMTEADRLLRLRDSISMLQQHKTLLELEKKYESEKREKELALLNSENELNELKLLQEINLRMALARENLLKDSAMRKEKAYNQLLGRENELRIRQLENERELKAALSRENLLKNEQLAKEKSLRWQLTAGVSLLLVSGLLIFFLYRRQRSKNRIIQQQADDMQILMKEIHHRVKNNLQVISSLLDLQSLTIGDREASAAIRESRDRVYSMALIHQNLYREDYIHGIDMNDYLNKLVPSLFQSYNANKTGIRLETDIDPVRMDIDQVIPIGLIVNELVSNALKYAFHQGQAGLLHVSLKKQDAGLQLRVCDNGKGFPEGMNIYQTQSFGFKLVKAFAQKLKAKLEAFNENGACVSLYIHKIKTTA